jgi:pimeloyl-ACP methyl ester carboxylesterase
MPVIDRRPLRITAHGHSLEAAWWGPPPEAAPSIVLLHEGLGCVAMWRDFPLRLAQATGLGVFAYSRLGYGHSDRATLPRPLSYMHDEAELLPRVLDAAGIRRCVLLGHSDGGSIAPIHAGTTQDFRVRGLVLLAPHFLVEDMTIASIEAARAAYETTDLRQRLGRYHADPDNAFRGWNDAWLDPAFRKWRIDDVLPYIRVPMLILQGADDAYGTPEQLRVAEREVSCPLETILIEGANHAPHLSAPDRVLNSVAAFTHRLFHVHERALPLSPQAGRGSDREPSPPRRGRGQGEGEASRSRSAVQPQRRTP